MALPGANMLPHAHLERHQRNVYEVHSDGPVASFRQSFYSRSGSCGVALPAHSVPAVAKNKVAPFYSFSKIAAIFGPIVSNFLPALARAGRQLRTLELLDRIFWVEVRQKLSYSAASFLAAAGTLCGGGVISPRDRRLSSDSAKLV